MASRFSSLRDLRDLRLIVAGLCLLLTTRAEALVPNAPTALGAAVIANTTVYLSVDDNSTNETGFDIYQTPSGGSTLHFQILSGSAQTTATTSGTGNVILGLFSLNASTTYTIQVASYAGSATAGNLSAYTTVTVTTADFNTPAIAKVTNTNETALRFAIVDNAFGEAGFFYEYRIPPAAFAYAGAVGANVSNLDFTGWQPGTSYEFRIRSFKGTAASPTSVTAYSNTYAITTPLNAPTSLVATSTTEGTVNLNWADNSAVEGGYAVYYRLSGSGSYTLLDYTAANATTYSVSGLVAGTAYDFQVAAAYQSTTIIESNRSNTLSATTKDGFTSGPAPPIFYNQSFSYQAVVSAGSARSSWSITGLPAGLTFNSSTGIVSGTPTVTGVFTCPMTATFANGWTTNSSLSLRVIRAAAVPVNAATIAGQTLTNGGNTAVSLTDKFADPDAESAVRVVTNIGTMDFILYNTATPQTVTNFLGYVNNASNSGNYNGAVFHRSIPGFIVQGGAFKVESVPNNFSSITTVASPINEPGISNLRGTVAMAKLGTNPNSATNQFFVNLGDNSSNLDNQNGGFTAFARVAGNGMTVADAMAALPTVNSTVNLDGTPTSTLTDWPLTSGSTMDTTKVVSITSAAPVAVLSYSATGNTNPAAVSASISGTQVQIGGVAGGQSNVTVTATDLDGSTVSQTFSVTVNQAPAFTSSTPSAAGIVGVAYPFSYSASGFPTPTFSVTSGTLPLGLSLSSGGVISGTPTTAGTFSGVVTATNSTSTATQGFSITVNQVPAFTNGPPPGAGAIGTLYDFSFTASGSPAPTFAVTTGPLPTGLSLSTAGVISGTPTAAGVFTGTVTVSNVAGSAAQDFSITVPKLAATVTLGSLAQTYDGTPRPATATTTPAGKTVTFTYAGSPTAPTNAGSYAVVGTIDDANYAGSASGTLVVAKATAPVTLGSLAQTYDGNARNASATTNPASLSVTFTYGGSPTAPTNAGNYAVVGTINDTNYAGSGNGSLVVAKATASVTLSGLTPTYDGSPKPVTATTTPAGLTVNITYDGSPAAPTNHGSYAVVASIDDINHTGTGNATLTIGGQSAEDWRTQHFTTGQISAGLAADDADPDGDGIKNLAEYALGLDPLSRSAPLLPTRDANGLTLTFTRPKNLPGVTYGAESTDSLGSWIPVTLEVISDGPVQTVRACDPLTSGNPARRFIRLFFGVPPP